MFRPQTKKASCKSACPKGGGWCSRDSLVDNQTVVFHPEICRDKFYGKNPVLLAAANRYKAA